jgi:hypothetical protein
MPGCFSPQSPGKPALEDKIMTSLNRYALILITSCCVLSPLTWVSASNSPQNEAARTSNNEVLRSAQTIGGTVEGKITNSFMKKMRSARQPAPGNPAK